MRARSSFLDKHDNLLPLSAGITAGIMSLLFILFQFLSFMSLRNDLNSSMKKMVVRELIKLQFTPEVGKTTSRITTVPKKAAQSAGVKKNKKQPNFQELEKSPDVASPAQEFDVKKLISRKANTAKRASAKKTDLTTTGISTDVTQQDRVVADYDFRGVTKDKYATLPAARKSQMGGTQGPTVSLGGGDNSLGDGLDSSNIGISGRGTSRAARGVGGGTNGATISLPFSTGGQDVAIDLHALIKWMKAHPGRIPKLVAHDMGHRTGDLSSAVPFKQNGRGFVLLLSCNEIELLLRICLIEGSDFTMLKDSGIREESNYLKIGNVVREKGAIQSLISSRRAPTNRANAFYQIFWSWWQGQLK